MPIPRIATILAALFLLVLAPMAAAQPTTLSYQGQLQDQGQPFTGNVDLEFRLFDQLSGGTEVASPQTRPAWPVADGLFQVELDFGASAFNGAERYLQVTVNGATLIPRQRVTATPYALLAAATADGAIGGSAVDPAQVQLRVTGSCPTGQAIRAVDEDGSVSCEPDDVGWRLTGNENTGSGSFLGTIDLRTLVLAVGNAPALRLEPSTDAIFEGLPVTANKIGGSWANSVVVGVRGASIGGGGMPTGSESGFLNAGPNRVSDHYGTVSGGYANLAGDDSGSLESGAFSTVSGGASNQAAFLATIGGGFGNVATGAGSAVGGGQLNEAAAEGASVCGGLNNSASGFSSGICGGQANLSNGDHSVIGGGTLNQATNSFTVVAGGRNNIASSDYAVIGGGAEGRAVGFTSVVGGGEANIAAGDFSVIAGGLANEAIGMRSVISGGRDNYAVGTLSTIPGGQGNCAGADWSFAAGRFAKVRTAQGFNDPGACLFSAASDTLGDVGTFVWSDSQASAFASTGRNQFLVRAEGGAAINTNAPRAPLTVEGNDNWNPTAGNGFGDFHVGTEQFGLSAGIAKFGGGAGTVRLWAAGGNYAINFVTNTNATTLSVGPEGRFGVPGRVGVRRTALVNALEVEGNASKTTAGDWLANSDARIKTDVREIDNALDRLMQVRPVTFRYTEDYRKAHPDVGEARYYNVIAQEFARVFPDAVKGSGETVPGLAPDADGEILQVDVHPALITAIAAVQELAVRLEQAEAENADLHARLSALEALLIEDPQASVQASELVR